MGSSFGWWCAWCGRRSRSLIDLSCQSRSSRECTVDSNREAVLSAPSADLAASGFVATASPSAPTATPSAARTVPAARLPLQVAQPPRFVRARRKRSRTHRRRIVRTARRTVARHTAVLERSTMPLGCIGTSRRLLLLILSNEARNEREGRRPAPSLVAYAFGQRPSR